MVTRILWSPEHGKCNKCGVLCAHIRRYSSGNEQTKLCRGCWRDFLNECNVEPGPWKDDVMGDWCKDVDLRLVFEEEDGTPQEVKRWN